MSSTYSYREVSPKANGDRAIFTATSLGTMTNPFSSCWSIVYTAVRQGETNTRPKSSNHV